MLLSVMPASAFEADLDGTNFNIDTVYCRVVGPGVTRSQLLLTAGSRQVTVYTSTLSRKAGAEAGVVEPRVIIGRDQCRTGEALSSMAQRHTGGDTQYLTGINGDFFITSSFASQHEFGDAILGYPNMSCVIDGKIAAPDMIDITSRENALIITDDNWFIDATDLRYRVLNNDGSVVVDATAVNYPRRGEEMVVYNSYMGATTATGDDGRELVLRLADGAQWNVNKSVKFIVDSDWRQGGNSAIPADGIVISCGPQYSNEWIDGLRKGDIVKLKIVLSLPAHDALKPAVQHVIGGDVRILNRGEITRTAIRFINTPTSRYQRSLVGFSEDRDMMVFAAVDGTGLTYFESAALMKALGCYDALDFDGGGSTAIWSADSGIYNKPRDGSERAIGNALYFTLKAPVDKEVASIRFADHAVVMPLYGTYKPVIYGYNKYGQLVDTDIQGAVISAPEALGSCDGNTLLATGEGLHPLTATLGSMTATVAVTVDASVPARARYESMLVDNIHPAPIALYSIVGLDEMPVSGKAYQWTSSDPAVAVVDENGAVHGVADGTATITASRGSSSIEIVVTVQCPKARLVSMAVPGEEEEWRGAGTGVKVSSLVIAEKPAFAIDYQITNTRGPKLQLRRNMALYSWPDAVEISFNPGDLKINGVGLSLIPNGQRPVTVSRDVTPGQPCTVSFDLSEFFDATDPGMYPVSLQNVSFDLGDARGTYHLDIDRLDLLYRSFDGVESVALPSAAPLRAMVSGTTVMIATEADALTLHDLSGRTVATAAHTAVVEAPAAGLYILRATIDGNTTACKVIVR